jgi:hypothetical protein
MPEEKIIFIHIPKNGGMSVRRALKNKCKLVKTRFNNTYHIPMSAYIENKEEYSFSFAVKRNPYDRFRSAFTYLMNSPPSVFLLSRSVGLQHISCVLRVLGYENDFENFCLDFSNISYSKMDAYRSIFYYFFDDMLKNFKNCDQNILDMLCLDKHWKQLDDCMTAVKDTLVFHSSNENIKEKLDKKFSSWIISDTNNVVHDSVFFAPQTQFIYDNDNCLLVDRVLCLERLEHDFHQMVKDFGLQISIEKEVPHIHKRKKKFTYTDEMKEKVYEYYRRDFELLGYDK